jgi:hypothetical protein
MATCWRRRKRPWPKEESDSPALDPLRPGSALALHAGLILAGEKAAACREGVDAKALVPVGGQPLPSSAGPALLASAAPR